MKYMTDADMPNYRCAFTPGGIWFFTVNLLQRHGNDLLVRENRFVAQSGATSACLIRDDADYRRHVDYVHVNPLKHGHVGRVQDWPYSTFHQYLEAGIYPVDWCGDVDVAVRGDE